MNKRQMMLTLSELGESSDQVRDSLVKLGISGKQSTCHHCLISNYLQRQMPGVELAGWFSYIELHALGQSPSPPGSA